MEGKVEIVVTKFLGLSTTKEPKYSQWVRIFKDLMLDTKKTYNIGKIISRIHFTLTPSCARLPRYSFYY